jgi:hypothetical protein
VRNAALGWLIALPVTAATMLWCHAHSEPTWPFGRDTTSPGQILLRYELIGLVYLAYVTIRSIPVWFRYRAIARRDAPAIDASIRAEQWERAGLLLHRYCLLVSAVRRRMPGQVNAWDGILRRRLTRHRRLYLYAHGPFPSLPPDPMASFSPAVLRPLQPSLWSLVGLIPIALMLTLMFVEVQRQGRWEILLAFNVVVLTLLCVSYGIYFVLALFGRSKYYRLAPGVLQVIRFAVPRRRPRIRTFHLRRMHVVLDLTAPWLSCSVTDGDAGRRTTFRFPKGPEAEEGLLRAVLSTAPTPPLSEEDLLA